MNLHYQYYKAYYEDPSSVKKVNEEILAVKCTCEPLKIDEAKEFTLRTTYPGLLAGIGYVHESGTAKDDAFKLGFSFDYVTGMPYLPGSSLKGVLRSAFQRYPSYIAELLGITTGDVRLLEEEIFEKGRDVFLDVFPSKGNGQSLLGEDYITSHRAKQKEFDGLTDPEPIRFLKILPETEMVFRFILQNTVITATDGTEISLRPGVKKDLFKELLLQFGAGAKTNVGYGRFKETGKK